MQKASFHSSSSLSHFLPLRPNTLATAVVIVVVVVVLVVVVVVVVVVIVVVVVVVVVVGLNFMVGFITQPMMLVARCKYVFLSDIS